MVEKSIINTTRRYLGVLHSFGIHPSMAVLFGSCARGDTGEYSDIDLVVVAPELDGPRSMEIVENLWRATALADNRIEPIPCGEKEWETDQSRPILEIARKEGVIINAN
jgi:predicted nucleotidyltransferase